jgi:hypothetical protein
VTSEICGIVSGVGIPLAAVGVYLARRWIDDRIVSKLTNGDTPVAKYAHDARDNAEAARDFAEKAYNTALSTNALIVAHITNRDIHRVPR